MNSNIEKLFEKERDVCRTRKFVKEMSDVKNSQSFKDIAKMRNNIVHNNPPLMLENPVQHRKDGISTFGQGKYINSKKVIIKMDMFLKQYFSILDILIKVAKDNNYLKNISR